MMQQVSTMLEVAHVMARLQEIVARGDPLAIEFACWLGVHDTSSISIGSEEELWTPRDVAIAALRGASNRPSARSFADGLVQLRRCKYFSNTWNPGVFVTDPFAMLCVAIGIRHFADTESTAWLVDLAKRTIQSESKPWRIGLLGAATLVLINEPISKIPPEILIALSAKGLIPFDKSVAHDAAVASMALDSPPPEAAAIRLAALRVLSTPEGTITQELKIPIAKLEPQTASTRPTLQHLPSTKIKILFLGANPSFTKHMALDVESREIEDRLRASPQRDNFEFVKEGAVRIRDLQAALLRHKPQIVHFSAHGRDERINDSSRGRLTREFLPPDETNDPQVSGELLVEDDTGKAAPISGSALAELLSVVGGIRCVVLNACHSVTQAEAISQHVEVVVGMNQAIENGAAISFAWAFYQGLAFGRSVRVAFELGKSQIKLAGFDQSSAPQLFLRTSESELYLFSPETTD